jgi:hypothetical protein
MDDARVREFETSLWTGDQLHFQNAIDDTCLMVLPASPFIYNGQRAKDAVLQTPHWTTVTLAHLQISRPQEGMIVVAYDVSAERTGSDIYRAYCSSTYRRLAHDDWRVVQHQQTPPLGSTSSKAI